jgi:hypothetical protein
MKWHLTFQENGQTVTKTFATMDEMFNFAENARLQRFKAKRVG